MMTVMYNNTQYMCRMCVRWRENASYQLLSHGRRTTRPYATMTRGGLRVPWHNRLRLLGVHVSPRIAYTRRITNYEVREACRGGCGRPVSLRPSLFLSHSFSHQRFLSIRFPLHHSHSLSFSLVYSGSLLPFLSPSLSLSLFVDRRAL